jgi:hypothetical protein
MHTEPDGPGPGLLGFAGAGSGKGATPLCGPRAMATGTAAQLPCAVPEPVPPLPPPGFEPLPLALPPGPGVAGAEGGLAGGAVDVICERPPHALATTIKHALTRTTSLFRQPFRPGSARNTPELRIRGVLGIMAE